MTVMQDRPLYDALMQRTSVRRYRPEPLPDAVLDRIRALPDGIQPLIPENEFHVDVRKDMRVDRSMLRAFGAYGALVNPPHALIPYIQGERYPLVDWGYRTQQLMIALTKLEIASCYIGVVGRQASVRRRLDLPHNAHLGALLIFGQPLRSLRESPSDKKRLPIEEIFFEGSFDHPASPGENLLPILQAASRAPSAVNTQPWRFLWQNPWLHLFVQRHNRSYLSRASQPFRYVDGGIVMANISLALRAASLTPAWRFDSPPPAHPDALEYLSCLRIMT
ncbi:MAG: nitroreductase family protein [Anaerolineales bacterium]|nr:nitroreductase family protein [Anaerolineales bacterium]